MFNCLSVAFQGISIMPASAIISINPPVQFKVDRPFLFHVKENNEDATGLFVGSIRDV